jgi:uncharacterized protein with HEPN domain
MLTAEQNALLLEKMKSVLKGQDPNELIIVFLSLINSGDHQKALLYGCKECKPQETNLFRMLIILLWHFELIGLDLNKKDEGSILAITYCITNQNFDLLKILVGWGASSEEINADSEKDIYSRYTDPIKAKIQSYLMPEFSKLSNDLNRMFLSRGLPDKNDIATDRENEVFDGPRIMFINRTINFILSHLKDDAPSRIITFCPSPAEVMELNNFKLSQLKLALFRIAKTVGNLSGSLRSYYSKCFQPVPFTWVTLEQLCFFELLYEGTVNSIIVVPTGEWLHDQEASSIGANFLKKGWDILYLSDRFIPLILNDLITLRNFLSVLSEQMVSNKRTLPEPIHLPNIKAVTSYIDNNRSLAQLLKLTSFQNNASNLKSMPKEIKGEGSSSSSSPPVRNVIQPKIDTLVEKHALLRTIQYIGDFNAKKLSSDFYKLDSSIDWRALVTIRDAIAHQDERDYKYQMDLLLNDPEMLKGIFEEILDLHKRIAVLIIKQEKRVGMYYGDAEAYCERVISLENEKYELIRASEQNIPAKFQLRVAVDQQEFFIQSLIAAKIDEQNPNRLKADFVKLIDECKLLFSEGKEISRTLFGEILMPLAYLKKKGNKVLYEKLKSILESAITPIKIDYKTQEIQQQAAAAQREQEREARFTGLELVRKLSKKLGQNPEEKHKLTLLKRVESALASTDNMFQFLSDCGYFHKEQPELTTVEQWDVFNEKEGRPSLINHLKNNEILNNAIEYNFGQLLQHLDTIKKCKIIPQCALLSSNYEQLRNLRNYIEHGSPFYDFARFVTLGNKAVDTRYEIICNGLDCVLELYVFLRELKDVLTDSVVKEKFTEQKEASSSSGAKASARVHPLSIFVPVPGARHKVEFPEERDSDNEESMLNKALV